MTRDMFEEWAKDNGVLTGKIVDGDEVVSERLSKPAGKGRSKGDNVEREAAQPLRLKSDLEGQTWK